MKFCFNPFFAIENKALTIGECQFFFDQIFLWILPLKEEPRDG